MQQPLYTITSLQKNHGHKPVLDIKDITLYEGEIIGLVGSNGSGKSTLLRHLAFLETPDKGEVYYRNYAPQNLPLHVRREIGILLPEPYLLKRSVKDNLLFGLRAHGIKEDETMRLHEALELVGLLPKKFLKRSWHELSSGETQRVAFAARLILRPKTLLLDEPTNSLDISGIPVFTEAILHAHEVWKSTIIIASHDLDWLSSIATRKLGLHFGRMMEFSTTNLIVGKWHEEGESLVYRFNATESMALPKSWRIGEKRGVAINPRMIEIFSQKMACCNTTTHICLNGVVREILHLTKSDEVSVKVAVGSQLIECIEPFEVFKSRPFYPSESLQICFSQEAIKIPN
ncbi:MAG: ABC transporter ATP-binding protein [Campylobacterales bacterium]|nr:ABC transporter ATP-binding protein [Campylobacterales bacterium]